LRCTLASTLWKRICGGGLERKTFTIQVEGVGAAPTLRSIKCGRRVKRNSPYFQYGEGGAVPSFRSNILWENK
jgi:hypothetical protein